MTILIQNTHTHTSHAAATMVGLLINEMDSENIGRCPGFSHARCPKTTLLTHDLRMLAHFPSPGVYPPVCAKDLFPQLGQEVGHIHLEVQALDLLVAHLRYRPLHHVHAGQLYVSLLPARTSRECSLHVIFF